MQVIELRPRGDLHFGEILFVLDRQWGNENFGQASEQVQDTFRSRAKQGVAFPGNALLFFIRSRFNRGCKHVRWLFQDRVPFQGQLSKSVDVMDLLE
jgi:hypothetical protein